MSSSPVVLGTAPRPAAAMPLDGPLVDTFGRIHSDLRLSLTDRCNLRCTYCMPAGKVAFQDPTTHLTRNEILRVAAVARDLGVRRVRLTGGEPLLRPDVVAIVAGLAGLGFEDLSLTTNGTRLAALARALADAGLRRVNVSCDSLRPERFARLRRHGSLPRVLAAMDEAERVGLLPLKVNVVPLVGENDDEIEAFASFARRTGRIVRFVEYMPLDAEARWARDAVLGSTEILRRIGARWTLHPAEPDDDDTAGQAPATRYRFADGIGEIGVVPTVTEPFCDRCDRLRLMADGAVRNCLFAHDEPSVRAVLRSGGTDEEVALVLRHAVWAKRAGHGIDTPGFRRPVRSMSMIGG